MQDLAAPFLERDTVGPATASGSGVCALCGCRAIASLITAAFPLLFSSACEAAFRCAIPCNVALFALPSLPDEDPEEREESGCSLPLGSVGDFVFHHTTTQSLYVLLLLSFFCSPVDRVSDAVLLLKDAREGRGTSRGTRDRIICSFSIAFPFGTFSPGKL